MWNIYDFHLQYAQLIFYSQISPFMLNSLSVWQSLTSRNWFKIIWKFKMYVMCHLLYTCILYIMNVTEIAFSKNVYLQICIRWYMYVWNACRLGKYLPLYYVNFCACIGAAYSLDFQNVASAVFVTKIHCHKVIPITPSLKHLIRENYVHNICINNYKAQLQYKHANLIPPVYQNMQTEQRRIY